MLVCTSILWALMQLSSAHLESRQPCALISITPGGSMVSATCKTLDGQHIWNVARRSYRNLHGGILFCTSLEQGWFLVWRKVRGVLVLGQGFYRGQRGIFRGGAHAAEPCSPTDPAFIHAELIPDSAERNDDKLYFFFRERSAEAPQSPAVYARIGRICLVCDHGAPCWSSTGPALVLSTLLTLAGSWE